MQDIFLLIDSKQHIFISHIIFLTDLHPSPAPHFKTFQVFLICCPKRPSYSTIQSQSKFQHHTKPVPVSAPHKARPSFSTTQSQSQFQHHTKPVTVSAPHKASPSFSTTQSQFQFQHHTKPVPVSAPHKASPSFSTLQSHAPNVTFYCFLPQNQVQFSGNNNIII
jgi:hypothetical protein